MPSSQHIQLKMNQQQIYKLKIIKFLEENLRVSLHDLGFGNVFSEIHQKCKKPKKKIGKIELI